MSINTAQPPLPAALVPQGEIFYTTLHDPEGVLAQDLCTIIYRMTYWKVMVQAVPVLDRPENFYVMADNAPDQYYVRRYVPAAIENFEHELKDWEYPAVIKIGFDPANIKDEQMRRLWSDPLARACWFGLRYRRITNQYFKDRVEGFAAWTRARLDEGTLTRSGVRYMFKMMGDVFGASENQGVVAARLFPYLTGEKVFEFVVEEAAR